MARPTKWVDTPEYVRFVRRVLQAMRQRRAQFEPEHLGELSTLARELSAVIADVVISCREAGYTWDDIGAAVGTSKQAAQQRWGKYETAF